MTTNCYSKVVSRTGLTIYVFNILQVPVTLYGVFPVTEVYKDGTLMMTLG